MTVGALLIPCKVDSFASLRELILVEEFRKSLNESIVVHLNEQKMSSLSATAVTADEYVLTHKVVFPAGAPPERSRVTSVPLSGMGQDAAARTTSAFTVESRVILSPNVRC